MPGVGGVGMGMSKRKNRVSRWQRGIGTVAAVLLLWGVERLPGVAAQVSEIEPLLLVEEQTRSQQEEELIRLNQQGVQQYQSGQFQEAFETFDRILAIVREIGDRESEGIILNILGLISKNLGQYREAIDYFRQTLAIYREVGNRAEEGTALNNIGSVYDNLGQYDEALDYLQQALAIVRETENRPAEGTTLNNIGGVVRNLGRYDEALDYYQQALAVFREVGDRAREGTVLNNLGFVYNNLGQYDAALDYYQQALAIHRDVGDRAREGSTLNNLGLVSHSLGQYGEALDRYEQALAIFREVGDRAGVGITLSNLGEVARRLGQYGQALDYYQQALAIHREVGNRAGVGVTLNTLGAVARNLGKYDEAVDYYQQALDIAREIGDRPAEGTALNNLGLVDFHWGRYDRAVDRFERALSIVREIGDRPAEGTTFNNLGLAADKQGKYDEALRYYQQALAIHREVGNRPVEGTTLNNLGSVARQLGEYENALRYYQQALTIFRDMENRAEEGITLNNIGAALLLAGQIAAAEQTLFDAIEVWESLRGGLTDESKISLFDTIAHTYRHLQIALIAQNKTEAALEISERGRARAFVELMALRSSNQSLEEFVPPPPPTLPQIRQVAQEQNATLVEYSLAEDRLFIWVVSPTGDIAFRRVKIEDILGNVSLSELVRSSRYTMGVRSAIEVVWNEDNPATAQTRLGQLHQLLIEPIADLLPTNPEERVIFVPQAELFLVPFPALQDANGTYLIEKHTILTAPAIQVLELTNSEVGIRNSERGEVLVVGNPTMPTVELLSGETLSLSSLPGAEREADAIADFLGTEALTGDAATKSAVLERLPQARIIHLATHGLLDDFGYDVPGAIALAASGDDNGLLTAGEILGLNLNAELVVLSACDTGRGEITGDGVIGLSRSLVTAGVPSIVVSLWKVDDAATNLLMQQFYQNWQENGDKAIALRQAMLTTMQQHPEPRHWAAFTLIGEAQ